MAVAPSELGQAISEPSQLGGKVIELFPSQDQPDEIDLLGLNPETLNMFDRSTQFQMIRTLRRRSYDPQYSEALQVAFPSGETQFPLSQLEISEFDIMTDLMAHPETEATDAQRNVLSLLNGVEVDESIRAIREEARLREGMDTLIARYEIGGYKMGRQVIREADRQNEADKAKASYLRDLVHRFGTDAYLTQEERELLNSSEAEDNMEREYRRTHRFGPPANLESDMAVLYRNGTQRSH